MEIKIFRPHSADCPDKADRYASRCGCPLWGEFNWTHSQTTLDGKERRQGQNKWTLKTRTKAEALRHAAKLENDLEALLEGKPVRQKSITVEAAVQEWQTFRSKNGLTNTKPKFMGDKLVEWCKKNDVLLLSATTPDQAIKFRMSLPFRTGDSSSLSVHWSVIGGFFNWAVGMGYIPANPIPNTARTRNFVFATRSRRSCPRPRSRSRRFLRPLPGG